MLHSWKVRNFTARRTKYTYHAYLSFKLYSKTFTKSFETKGLLGAVSNKKKNKIKKKKKKNNNIIWDTSGQTPNRSFFRIIVKLLSVAAAESVASFMPWAVFCYQ